MSRNGTLRCGFRFVVTGGALMLAALPLSAQSASIGGVAAHSQMRLLGDLVGGYARVTVPLSRGGLSPRLGFKAIGGRHSNRSGIPCAGLINQANCFIEPLEDRGRLTEFIIGLELGALQVPHASVHLAIDFNVASAHADTRGKTSGQTLSASKSMRGTDLSLEASWQPAIGIPFAIEGGVSLGSLSPWKREQVVDGYTPFDGSFNMRDIRLGIAWRRASR